MCDIMAFGYTPPANAELRSVAVISARGLSLSIVSIAINFPFTEQHNE